MYCKEYTASLNKSDFITFIESKKTALSFKYVEEFNALLSREIIEIPPVFKSINDFFKEDVLKKNAKTPELSTSGGSLS